MRRWLTILMLALAPSASRADNVFTIVHWSDPHAMLESHGTPKTNAATLLAWTLLHTNDGVWNVVGFAITGDTSEQTESRLVGGPDYNSSKMQWNEMTNWFFQIKTNGMFVWVCDGNHDADNFSNRLFDASLGTQGYDLSDLSLAWTNIWPLRFFTNQVGFVTNLGGGNLSQACAMTYTNPATGIKLLWLPLSCSFPVILSSVKYSISSNTAPQIQRMITLAAQYPDHNAILGAHFLLSWTYAAGRAHFREDYGEGTSFYFYLPHGKAPFETGALDIPNMLMGLSGHNRACWSGHVVLRATDGHPIDVQCFNSQATYDSFDGSWNGRLIRLIRFNATRMMAEVHTYDVLLDTEILTPLLRTNASTGQIVSYPVRWDVPLVVPHLKTLRLRYQ